MSNRAKQRKKDAELARRSKRLLLMVVVLIIAVNGLILFLVFSG